MITAVELKTACNQIAGSCCPGFKLYGTAAVEQLKKPCIFTELLFFGLRYESKNWARNSAGYKMTFLQQAPDEREQLQQIEKVREAFGLKLAVKDRKISVDSFDIDYAGEYRDLLQITVKLHWYENMYVPETGDLMENIEVQTVQEGE